MYFTACIGRGNMRDYMRTNKVLILVSDMGKMALKVSFRGMHAYPTELKYDA